MHERWWLSELFADCQILPPKTWISDEITVGSQETKLLPYTTCMLIPGETSLMRCHVSGPPAFYVNDEKL